jgi:hypothetical protein
LELIWDLEFVIWDFERYALCAVRYAAYQLRGGYDGKV